MGESRNQNQIKDVWSFNLNEELQVISSLLDEYPFIGMDTEFPGVVARPVGKFSSIEAFQFQLIRCNVDLLKIIQIGISLSDGHGRFPSPCCSWQFNFKFDRNHDLYSKKAIDMLTDHDIDFKRFASEGISSFEFCEKLFSSGLIMNPSITYITYSGGYDFGYLLKMLTCKPLPATEKEFFKEIEIYFPNFYDVREIQEGNEEIMRGGLQSLAVELGVIRVGVEHQAGSDSLVTLKVFTELAKIFNDGNLNMERFAKRLSGFYKEC